LQWIDAKTVANLVKEEHPQIIATILVHLEPDHASEVLSYLDPELSEDLIIRIATLDDVKPVAMRELNEVMSKLLSNKTETAQGGSIGGIKVAADIINYMKTETEASTIAGLRAFDETIAQKIIDEMFIFDGLMEIDDRGIQALLRDVPSEMLVTALKGTTPEMQNKIFKNMSTRAAETLREDLETKGPVKLSEVVDQQKEILQIVRRLAEEGTIILRGKGGDDQYV
jgi:flagellar motor switch protein FliG